MILHHDDLIAWRERVEAAGDPGTWDGPWNERAGMWGEDHDAYQWRLWCSQRIDALRYRRWWWWPEGHLVVAQLVAEAEDSAQWPLREPLPDTDARVEADQWCPVLLLRPRVR